MSLLDVVLVAKSFVKHVSDFLSEFKIVMSEDVSQLDDRLTSIAYHFVEELLLFVSNDLDHRCKDNAKQHINHWNMWKSGATSA